MAFFSSVMKSRPFPGPNTATGHTSVIFFEEVQVGGFVSNDLPVLSNRRFSGQLFTSTS